MLRSVVLVSLALLLGACGGAFRFWGDGKPDGSPTTSTPCTACDLVAPGVRVMTWNVYYGADLEDAVVAVAQGDPAAILEAVSGVWAQLQQTDFRIRARAIAAGIKDASADLIGLQEAALWQTQFPSDTFTGSPTAAETVAFDFVEILLDELEALGLDYEVAHVLETVDAEFPRVRDDGELEDLRLTDREVILARSHTWRGDAITIEDRLGGRFGAQTYLPSGFPLGLGWVGIDVDIAGEKVRFLSTHLEALDPDVRLDQTAELLLGPAGPAFDGKVIVVGDFNANAGVSLGTPRPPAYELMRDAGFSDAFVGASTEHGSARPTTDLGDIDNRLTERIDFVFHAAPQELLMAWWTASGLQWHGALPHERIAGSWPSDHGGLSVRLRLPGERRLPAHVEGTQP